MTFGVLGTVIALLSALLFAIGSVIAIRQKRLSQEARDLRELRETNVEAMGYIYDLELAIREASKELGRRIIVEKPEILKASFLEAKAKTEGNHALQDLAETINKLHADGKKAITGRGE